jgi:hypothetical protein
MPLPAPLPVRFPTIGHRPNFGTEAPKNKIFNNGLCGLSPKLSTSVVTVTDYEIEGVCSRCRPRATPKNARARETCPPLPGNEREGRRRAIAACVKFGRPSSF